MNIEQESSEIALLRKKAKAFDQIKREIKYGAEWGIRDRIEDIIDAVEEHV